MSACPIAWERLVDYWALDLPPAQVDEVDEHVFGCAACTAASARIASVAQGIRSGIPVVVTEAQLGAFRGRGMVVVESRFLPGERKEARYPEGVDLLVHRLCGLDLRAAERVHVTVKREGGEVLVEEPFAPFERDAGEVLIACQRHFSAFPPDVAFEVQAYERGASSPRTTTFVVPHVWGASAGRP